MSNHTSCKQDGDDFCHHPHECYGSSAKAMTDHTDDMVETIDTAILHAETDDPMWRGKLRDQIKAALRTDRDGVVEECAKVADMIVNEATEKADKLAMVENKGSFAKSVHAQYRGGREAAFEIADAIRALKGDNHAE